MTIAERPATLRRSTPRPSPVENIDPIDTTPVPPTAPPQPDPEPAVAAETEVAAAAPTPVAKSPKRGSSPKKSAPKKKAETEAETVAAMFKRARPHRERQIVVQLNSKIALEARDTLDEIVAYDSRTIRSGIETGIYLLNYLSKKEQAGEMPVLEDMLRIYNEAE